MEREFSAGGAVIRKMRGRWFVAVIEPHMDRPKQQQKKSASAKKKAAQTITALPKGAIDEGEKPEQTAIREVQEETGLNADVVSKLADIKYVYVRNWGNQARVFKLVSFYLLLYRSGKLDDIKPEMRIEVKKAFWIPLDEAPKALSYKGEREVIARALAYLNEHPELGDNAADAAH